MYDHIAMSAHVCMTYIKSKSKDKTPLSTVCTRLDQHKRQAADDSDAK